MNTLWLFGGVIAGHIAAQVWLELEWRIRQWRNEHAPHTPAELGRNYLQHFTTAYKLRSTTT